MLTPTDHTILTLESQRWKFPAAKEARALEILGMTPTRYYQVRDALIDHPAAEAAEPALIHRLRRLRDQRRRARSIA